MQACFQIIVQYPGFHKNLEEFCFLFCFFFWDQPQLHLTSFYAVPLRDLLPGQRAVAMISEMIHTASLVHDDVIDGSDQRRGKRTINQVWGERKVRQAETGPSFSSCVWSKPTATAFPLPGHLGWRLHPVSGLHGLGPNRKHHSGEGLVPGDRRPGARYILPCLSYRNKKRIFIIRQKLTQLCFVGEFMQLGSKENENERFKHYLEKTFKKTASLIANSCKAVCTFHPHAYVSEWREALVSTLDPSVVVDWLLCVWVVVVVVLRFPSWWIPTLKFMK